MSVTLSSLTPGDGQITVAWTSSGINPYTGPYAQQVAGVVGGIKYTIYFDVKSLAAYDGNTIQNVTGVVFYPPEYGPPSAFSPTIIESLPFGNTYYFRVLAEWQTGLIDPDINQDTGLPLNSAPMYSRELSNELSAMPLGSGNTGGGVVCFLGNAPVLTPSGYRRIDSLAVGDMVRTADGRDVAIQRVKHQRVVAPSAAVNPYVIPAGTWGAIQNLAISPRHAVAVPGRGMVEARELGLRQLSMRAAFDYYNLELPEWDNMVVAGVEVESLAPKKRVVMTAAQFREMVGSRSVDLAKLARIASVRADGSVDVMLTRKTRRM